MPQSLFWIYKYDEILRNKIENDFGIFENDFGTLSQFFCVY